MALGKDSTTIPSTRIAASFAIDSLSDDLKKPPVFPRKSLAKKDLRIAHRHLTNPLQNGAAR